MADIEVRGAEKNFGSTKVLKGVSLAIKDGEFLVLVGPSGCGKSTLLRMIAGLESFSKGDLRIGDRVMTDVPPKNRNIAMVFQNYGLYPHMTVERNMGFSLELARAPKEERREKVRRAAEILDLGPLLGRYPRQLSGGQRQRVAMGRAIVRDPSLFLFDEPLSNLDAKLRVQMRTEIKALHQRLGVTIIYVTHDQIEAMTMADRIAVMNGGVVEQLGTPLDLYDRPANIFVATFIGSPAMNLIGGRAVDGAASRRFLTRSGGTLDLPIDPPDRIGSTDVFLGVRPENLVLAPSGLEASVTLIEPMGSETQVLLESGGQSLVMLLRDRTSLRVGQRVSVAAAAEGLHFFDAVTGVAIREEAFA